jgi:hypothetical protein
MHYKNLNRYNRNYRITLQQGENWKANMINVELDEYKRESDKFEIEKEVQLGVEKSKIDFVLFTVISIVCCFFTYILV